MNRRKRLKNDLVRKLMRLSADKLAEVYALLGTIKSRFASKEKTLEFAGSWKDMDNDLFSELTDELHAKRAADRQIP
jgi:hypothetical protein